MITVNTTEVDARTVMISISGELLPGSAGNSESQKIKKAIESLPEEKTWVILNLLDLDYSSGDYLGSVFIALVQRHYKFEVVAKGKTKEALQNLLKSSAMDRILKIDFYEEIVEALNRLRV